MLKLFPAAMDEEDFIPDRPAIPNGNPEIVGDSSTLRSQFSSTLRVVDRHGFMSSSCDSNGLSPENSGELSPRLLRKRESKWLEMLEHWPLLMTRHYDKVSFWTHVLYLTAIFIGIIYRFVHELVKEFLQQFAQELGSICVGRTIKQR